MTLNVTLQMDDEMQAAIIDNLTKENERLKLRLQNWQNSTAENCEKLQAMTARIKELEEGQPFPDETITMIENRIREEYRKYGNSQTMDWVQITARKIYSSLTKPTK